MYNHVPVKVADIKAQFSTDEVSQVKNMQLFVIKGRYCGKYLLISYHTIVGVLNDLNDCWYLSNEIYSRTTSRQLGYFKKHNYHVVVNQYIVDDLLKNYPCI